MITARQRDVIDEAAQRLTELLPEAITDPESAHGMADAILLELLDELHPLTAEVAAAYRLLIKAAPWWVAA